MVVIAVLIVGIAFIKHKIDDSSKEMNGKIDDLKNNDLAHLTRATKLDQQILVKDGKMTRETYYALWGENPSE
jgi:hypothetical protein